MQRNLLRPSHALGSLENGFGRLFEDLVGTLGRPTEGRRYLVPMDLIESEEAWRLTVDLPGVAEDDVELSIEDGVLELRAERKVADLAEGEQARHVERASGGFARRLRLPGEVDVEAVEARLDSGVLTVELPKASAARTRRIEVKRG